MENNWKKNHPDQRKQAIEITSALMDVDYVPVDDVQELTAIERGDNGWREVSVENEVWCGAYLRFAERFIGCADLVVR